MLRSKIKKGILKGTAMLASVTFLLSASYVGFSLIPAFICMGCVGYLMFYAYVTGAAKDYEEGDDY